ncbi:MAG: putative DNA binding domain-containing protein [Anaerolineae bacterium]|nr:putative DNA binding domain-containing protein [Anaerolineae bacterium]
MDLHIHTPASKDYQQADVTYMDILQQAERRNLDIIAFTDHNTVQGYHEVLEEIHQLELLESLERINVDEQRRLNEYHRLFQTMMILPGFEFTATFGFHILGIFAPQTDVRYLEHLLLDLNIPPEALDSGETNVGASADVLTAYAAIRQAGGIVIAAHANSNHGVAMRGLSFGGQTRIAYTQDLNLHALEVTDLDRRGRHTTARFFDGSKPEYPRRMRCIQASDAHRLDRDPRNAKNLGLGERVTEIQLPELSFEAIYEVFSGNDFARTRPYRGSTAPYDHVLAARQEGPSIVQSFHESMAQRGGRLYSVIADVCGFANTNGGTLYVGVSADAKAKPVGVSNINRAVEQLKSEIQSKMTPPIDAQVDVLKTQGVSVIRVQVPPGSEPPYAIDDYKIYVRDETETSLAVRDEIVQLVLRSPQVQEAVAAQPEDAETEDMGVSPVGYVEPPRTGVEVIATEKRNKILYHHVRDLRNGNIVRNVTRGSARKLWHYAITQVEDHTVDVDKLGWHGDISLIREYKHGSKMHYDLAQRLNGTVHIYYGVTENGIQDGAHAAWRELLGLEEEE